MAVLWSGCREKCTVLVRSMDFLTVLLTRFTTADVRQIVPQTFWSSSLWNVLLSVISRPTRLGFNMADIEVMTQLPQQVFFTKRVFQGFFTRNISCLCLSYFVSGGVLVLLIILKYKSHTGLSW